MMTPFESAVRGLLEGSHGGRVYVPDDERGHRATPLSGTQLAMVDRVPEGWTVVAYEGRSYGLTRTTRVQGQSISISAEELGGEDLISANVYRTRKAEHLRPCEVSEAKVLAFLRGWTPA